MDERVVSSRSRCTPRGLKRKMSKYPLRPRTRTGTTWLSIADHLQIAK
ncbi:MAG TPA: hypothetical protein VF579_09020 [Candidatus Methylomirabilis sp.]